MQNSVAVTEAAAATNNRHASCYTCAVAKPKPPLSRGSRTIHIHHTSSESTQNHDLFSHPYSSGGWLGWFGWLLFMSPNVAFSMLNGEHVLCVLSARRETLFQK